MDKEMIETLIKLAFAGVNEKLEMYQKKIETLETEVSDLKTLTKLMDESIDKLKPAKVEKEDDFYSEYKNGGIG